MVSGGGQSRREPVDWRTRFEALAAGAESPVLRRFYEAGAVAADTPLEASPLVAFDLETTGLNPARHGIVSFGLVPFDLDRIGLPRSVYRVVRPRRELEDRSITIHQLTHDAVEDAPDLAEVADVLLEALTGRVAVVHYHPIERRFMQRAFERRFGEPVVFPLIDTMLVEHRHHRQRRWWDPRTWFRNPQLSLRLADCRRRYGLPEYSPHHALTDALATAELLQAQVAHHGGGDEAVGQWWL